jgi:hypothetical protein
MKAWWQSFTHWFNAIGATLLLAVDPISQALPSLQPYLGASFYKYAFIGLAVGNILIRQFKTSMPLTPILGTTDAKPTAG